MWTSRTVMVALGHRCNQFNIACAGEIVGREEPDFRRI